MDWVNSGSETIIHNTSSVAYNLIVKTMEEVPMHRHVLPQIIHSLQEILYAILKTESSNTDPYNHRNGIQCMSKVRTYILYIVFEPGLLRHLLDQHNRYQ